jgi:hypothetical protein
MRVKCCFWKMGEETGSWPKNEEENKQKSLPAMIRRRLTPLGQRVLDMFYRTSSHANQEQISWVVSCRHGDINRMISLLSSLAKKELLSPTDFSMSVHNAIVGFFSIAIKNKKSHTALSGGQLSFEMGLLEAYALQRDTKGTVGYMYYNTPMPPPYEGKVENDCPEVCLAVLLSGDDNDNKDAELLSKNIYLFYVKNRDFGIKKNSFNISNVLEFLQNDSKRFKISIPGGNFLLERIYPKE